MCKDTDARKSTAVLGKATLCARREGAWLVKEQQNKIAVETGTGWLGCEGRDPVRGVWASCSGQWLPRWVLSIDTVGADLERRLAGRSEAWQGKRLPRQGYHFGLL